jgi:hypothetical protein
MACLVLDYSWMDGVQPVEEVIQLPGAPAPIPPPEMKRAKLVEPSLTENRWTEVWFLDFYVSRHMSEEQFYLGYR